MFNTKVTSSVDDNNGQNEKKYFVSLDIGTTSVRSFVFDSSFAVVGKARFMVCFIWFFNKIFLLYDLKGDL